MNKIYFRTLFIGAGLVASMLTAPSAFANGKCSNYRLSAFGGDGGFRLMNNQDHFRKASNGTVSGKVCQNGRVRIELSKRHPNTHVALVVNGREYVFREGDRGDRIANNWFRRYIDIDLGHKRTYKQNESHYGGYQNHGYGYKDHNYGSKKHDYGYKDHDYGSQKHDYGYRQSDKFYSNDHYGPSKGGVYYGSNQGYGYKSGNGYNDPGYGSGLNHDHKFLDKHRVPRFALHSKKHRKAHRKGIPHKHRRHQQKHQGHGHGHGYIAYN